MIMLARLLVIAMLPVAALAAPSQRVEAAALCRAASEAVIAARASLPAGTVLEARCEPWTHDVEVAAGPLELRAQLAAAQLLDGVHDVAVELRVAQRVERTVRVPLHVTLQAPQWCAREGVAMRQELLPQHFEPCARPLQRAEQWRLAGKNLPAGRLKRALRSGEMLSMADIAEPGQQMRGDVVTVRYQAGALALESIGELSQDARIGDPVRVRVRGSAESVLGRLAAASVVELDPQP